MAFVLIGILSLLLILLVVITYRLHSYAQKEANDAIVEKTNLIQGWVYAALVFLILGIIACIYWKVKGTPYEGHLMEWLNIIVRVMHITFGIAWIGASFYFVFLENALNRTEGIRDELAGNLWAVHGGGFIILEKYKVAPKTIPKHLHWFKYESYFTWVSGLRYCLSFIILMLLHY
jgi:hypothetical protein